MISWKTTPSGPGLVLALLVALPAGLQAQQEKPPPPAMYALSDVTVVDAAGQRRSGMTLVIRKNLVETLRPGAPVPPGARLLEGDSLFIYPGLVDAWGEADYEFAEHEDDRQQVVPWNPSRSAQGFTPHRRIADALTATGSDLAGRRKAGVVAQAVHPTEGLAPGRGAVILDRVSAANPRDLVVRPTLGPTFTFEGSRRVYPSTLFGVIAFHRQTFEDAARMALVRSAYERDPRGLGVPRWDPDREVYTEVASGRVPVFFHADGAEYIRRVLGLADEFGFRPIIVGGGEAWKVADELRERGVPVLVSLDFPEPDDWEPDEASAGTSGGALQTGDLSPAAWREKQRLEDLYANAGRLAAAGVTFALTSGGGEADLREGARKAIEYGLSEEAALAALTTTPARLLGIPDTPRIEEGLAATFIVTDGPLFDEDARIVYTFVEGELEKGSTGRRNGGQPPAADLSGSWSMAIESSQGRFDLALSLDQDGNDLSGTAQGGPMGTLDIRNGNVSGSNVRFTFAVDAGGQTIEIEVSGTITDPDHFSGTTRSSFGPSEFEAERTGGGPGRGGVR